ncbi:MAG: peptidase S41, partial [Burkholderiaceae bacterium]|nr:peptidase S41 [Burkholderiaceae bacterium]
GANGWRVREADLRKHLGNGDDAAAAADGGRDELEEERHLAALDAKRLQPEYGAKGDFQLAQALNHFKGLPVTLSKVKPVARTADGKAEPKPIPSPKK